MIYRIGDTGLIPEFINCILDVPGNKITEETVLRLQQFQCAFDQGFIDNTFELSYNRVNGSVEYNPLPPDYSIYDSYYHPGNTIETDNLTIYPTDFIDIHTLPALCEIEITKESVGKIKQVQDCLTGSVYNNTNIIKPNGFYDEQTKTAIKNFQTQYGIGQPTVYTSGVKNIFPNYTKMWLSGKATGYEKSSQNVILTEDSTCISSYLIPIDNNFNYVFNNNAGIFEKPFIIKFLFYDANKDLMDLSSNTSYSIFAGDTYFSAGTLPAITMSSSQISYVQCVVKFSDGSVVSVNDILKCTIQIEKSETSTAFEPQVTNINYMYFSGRLNTVTYNKLKYIFGLTEVLDV